MNGQVSEKSKIKSFFFIRPVLETFNEAAVAPSDSDRNNINNSSRLFTCKVKSSGKVPQELEFFRLLSAHTFHLTRHAWTRHRSRSDRCSSWWKRKEYVQLQQWPSGDRSKQVRSFGSALPSWTCQASRRLVSRHRSYVHALSHHSMGGLLSGLPPSSAVKKGKRWTGETTAWLLATLVGKCH